MCEVCRNAVLNFMQEAPPAPPHRAASVAERKPFTALVKMFDLSNDEIAVLIGADRRTIARWSAAEAKGMESPVPAPVRHLFEIYREGYVSERLKFLLWMRQITTHAYLFYPVSGEENWTIRFAEVVGSTRFGPWVTVEDWPELMVGIKFCRARREVAQNAIAHCEHRIEAGVASGEGVVDCSVELARLKRIEANYARAVDDYAARFPAAKRGRRSTRGNE